MGFNNPQVPWSDLERQLSGRAPKKGAATGGRGPDGRDPNPLALPAGADGGDSPAWSRRRGAYRAPTGLARRRTGPRYAELHCHSNFSFLDGASHPEELAEEAARLGLDALALTDHDGFYGVVRFAEAAKAVGLPAVFGAELSLGPGGSAASGPAAARSAVPDPANTHLVVLAASPTGYRRLSRLLGEAHLRGGEKGRPHHQLVDLGLAAAGGHLRVLTGGRKGVVADALVREGPAAAARALDQLVALVGRDSVLVELWDHGDPLDSARNDALVALADRAGVACVATNNVHYATAARRPLATAVAAVRARRSLDDLDGWLPASGAALLRTGAEQDRRFRRYPGVVERAAEVGVDCAFDLQLIAPDLPPYPCPDGLDEMAYLRRLTEEGARVRYGPRSAPTHPRAYAQIDHELALIEALGFPGYFLIVWELVDFCRRQGILCQGRGSAANSAVCYALGITNADAVALGLLFERFLSPERDGPPDIDIDIESDRREEVIQYVYRRHGRTHAAQVANVITYRARSAVRDMAKALGYAPGQADAWAKQFDGWHPVLPPPSGDGRSAAPAAGRDAVPDDVLDLAAQVEHFPRHLGIHSGGMVLCDRPVLEVCPVEWARMEGRTVLQWDKEDCAAAGLVKFDLLGLGMLSALHTAIDLVRAHHDRPDLELWSIPDEDPEVYDMLCRADSVGVFQVESRAQMATLPRLRPRTFYDLVVEVALIRPGPIQGGSVHPYIRRRNGQEPVTYPHPILQPVLERTLGVPLFQEQLMQMAIVAGGFTPSEADQLRQAMGSKRSRERMEALRRRFGEGARQRGLTPEVIEDLWVKLAAFANYGFPESHSVSFAFLVYASSWLKRWYPAAFCVGLLNAQPMGFYSPHSLVRDARRHGVPVARPDLNASEAQARLEASDGARCAPPPAGTPPSRWGEGGPTVRLGLSSVRGVGEDLARRVVAGQPYRDLEDLTRRVPELRLPQLEALATAGAFDCFPARSGRSSRREALWSVGAAAHAGPDRLPGIVEGLDAPSLPAMSAAEEANADLWSVGIAADGHPTMFLRPMLARLGVTTAQDLPAAASDRKVAVAGVVTHRQRPATAAGITFMNLEDETGLINVVVSPGCWKRYATVARTSPALLVRGKLERHSGVVNVVAEHLEPLPLDGKAPPARNFR